jgi:ABC-type branched-subunit amino acid transport system ATPase component
MSDQEPLVVERLTAGYGQDPIVKSVSIRARAKEITAIVGPNGAGKSTLLKALIGIIRPTSGQVIVNGREVSGKSPENLVRLGISYVPQVANVFPSLTVAENLEMGGYLRKSHLRERMTSMTDMFPDLRLAMRRPARTLSGGQRTMLAIARTLMLDPSVLLLDEPTAGLSPKMEEAVWERIVAIRESGVCVVIVEQNTRRTLMFADQAYVLVNGANQLEGRAEVVREDKSLAALYIGGSSRPVT